MAEPIPPPSQHHGTILSGGRPRRLASVLLQLAPLEPPPGMQWWVWASLRAGCYQFLTDTELAIVCDAVAPNQAKVLEALY